jgi:DNA-binding transcriptional regulator LsrR (DeoR family)
VNVAKSSERNLNLDLQNLAFLARVASMYYEDGLTQQRISEQVGYSRSAISRFLTAAREAGVVEIRVHYPTQRDASLEAELKDRFEVDPVWVLKTQNWSYPRMLTQLGALAADLLVERIKNGMLLGVSWGTAVYEVVRALRPPHLPDLTVVQMIGALGTADPQIDGGELARSCARAFGGRYRILPAPAVVESPGVRDGLMNDRPVRDALSMAGAADAAILGIGTLEPSLSSLVRAEYLTQDELMDIAGGGAVGDVCAIFFDEEGQVLDTSIARRVIGLPAEALRKIPFCMGVAGGRVKAPAIRGALRSGLINALVTDDQAAFNVLQIERQNGPRGQAALQTTR